jgi:DNA helicase-2/ATP-dependent DNA helicase PcrA
MVHRIYPRYQELLRQSNGLDFDDLLLEVVRLFDLRETIHFGQTHALSHSN